MLKGKQTDLRKGEDEDIMAFYTSKQKLIKPLYKSF